MGLGLALTSPERIAGVVAMSGRILPEIIPRIVAADRLKGLPVELVYREYTMGHEISDESIGDISRWLREALGA